MEVARSAPVPEFDEGELWQTLLNADKFRRLFPDLTDRELHILGGVASGRTYAEIAERIGFRPKSIKNQGLVLLQKVSPAERQRIEATNAFVRGALPYLDEGIVRHVRSFVASKDLDPRTKKVLAQLARSSSTEELAEQLCCTTKAAKNNVSMAISSLDVRNRVAATTLWIVATETSDRSVD